MLKSREEFKHLEICETVLKKPISVVMFLLKAAIARWKQFGRTVSEAIKLITCNHKENVSILIYYTEPNIIWLNVTE